MGIAIGPVLSKLFELCVLDHNNDYTLVHPTITLIRFKKRIHVAAMLCTV